MNTQLKVIEPFVVTDKFWEVGLEMPDSFLKVKETLTRIGTRDNNKVSQIAYLLHKQGLYYIVHWKQMEQLDGNNIKMKSSDYYRLNKIVKMLERWELVSFICEPVQTEVIERDNEKNVKNSIFVVPFKEKDSWELVSNYNIGEIKE